VRALVLRARDPGYAQSRRGTLLIRMSRRWTLITRQQRTNAFYIQSPRLHHMKQDARPRSEAN